jgi:hypothetical protein
MDGLRKVKPLIKKISFPVRGKMTVLLADGRDVSVPLQYFPSIKRLNAEQREKWYVLDGEMFSFDDCNEIFHVEQILGKENLYKYNFINKKFKV